MNEYFHEHAHIYGTCTSTCNCMKIVLAVYVILLRLHIYT